MATYRVEIPGGGSVECDSPEAAAKLVALLKLGAAPAAPTAAAAATEPAPAVEVIDKKNGSTGNRGVDSLNEIETAGKLVWDWLTGDKDPRAAILDALKGARK